jgi:hypothetical protein
MELGSRQVWPVGRGCLLLLGTWSHLRYIWGSVLAHLFIWLVIPTWISRLITLRYLGHFMKGAIYISNGDFRQFHGNILRYLTHNVILIIETRTLYFKINERRPEKVCYTYLHSLKVSFLFSIFWNWQCFHRRQCNIAWSTINVICLSNISKCEVCYIMEVSHKFRTVYLFIMFICISVRILKTTCLYFELFERRIYIQQ